MIVPTTTTAPIRIIRRIGNPATNNIANKIATTIAVEPKSLWAPAITTPKINKTIRTGKSVCLKLLISLLSILRAKKSLNQIKKAKRTNSTDSNDKLPNLTQR